MPGYFRIDGRWTVSVSSARPFQTTGDDGVCTVEPFALQIERSSGAGDSDYTGWHGETRMACTGVTEAATQLSGVRDTVITFPADSVTASVWVFCSLFSGCGTETATINLVEAQITLLGSLGRFEMTGAFFWKNANGQTGVIGEWRAAFVQ